MAFRLIPRPTSRPKSDDALGRGMEFAIVVAAFLGLGYLLDRWLGTKPVFMIVMVLLGIVGEFASLWYGYEERMKRLEHERAAARAARQGSRRSVAGGSATVVAVSAEDERVYAPAIPASFRDVADPADGSES